MQMDVGEEATPGQVEEEGYLEFLQEEADRFEWAQEDMDADVFTEMDAEESVSTAEESDGGLVKSKEDLLMFMVMEGPGGSKVFLSFCFFP